MADAHMPHHHRRMGWRNTITEGVVAVGNIDVRSKHVVVADLDKTTGIDHYIAIEVIPITDPNPNTVVIAVLRPKPTTLCEGVVIADFDLPQSAATATPFYPIADADPHPERAIGRQPDATC
jgi:hypothetical protein